MNAYNEDIRIEGKWFDQAYTDGKLLLREVFPDTAIRTLTDWETTYALDHGGDQVTRQARLKAAVIARGGISRAYFIALAAAMGYTVTITEGADDLFLIGITQLPHALFDPSVRWAWTVVISGVSAAADL